MNDYARGVIEVRYASLDYGPFYFDFTNRVPATGVTIQSVSVKSYMGKVNPGDPFTGFTETTSELLDALTGVSGDTEIAVYFNYPGVSLEGSHTLVFEITWSNGAQHPYYFYRVLAH
jgi:hypothetical protein